MISFTLSLSLSISLSLSLSLSLSHTHTHTHTRLLTCTRTLTHTHSHKHTRLSYTYIHTHHAHTITLFLSFSTLIHDFFNSSSEYRTMFTCSSLDLISISSKAYQYVKILILQNYFPPFNLVYFDVVVYIIFHSINLS